MSIEADKELKAYEKVWSDPTYFFAFGFGLGTLPVAPGTWGSLLGLPFFILFADLGPMMYLFMVLVCFAYGVFISERVSDELGVHDHKGIVWDEVCGMMLTLFLFKPSFWVIILGFILFRIFDILKPWPISYADKHIKGGLGIMLDDILAALYAWLSLVCLYYLGVTG